MTGKDRAVVFISSFQISLLLLSVFAFSLILAEFSGAQKNNSSLGDEKTKSLRENKSSSILPGLSGNGTSNLSISFDSIIKGIGFATAAFSAGQLIGSAAGLQSRERLALSSALGLGILAGKTIASDLLKLGTGQSILVGAGVGLLVFSLLYRKTEKKEVIFECKPFQAPSGGDNCEKCNDDEIPCSEYRCKSLGATCELVNKGTPEEKCTAADKNDVVPPIISPDKDKLTAGHSYTDVRTSPPGPGFRIVRDSSADGCLKAYTPLKFGIKTNELSQCKIDLNRTKDFESMRNFMGGSNLYSYEHEEAFSLPGAKVLKNSSLVLENGKDLTFFIRCRDRSGNENTAEYAVRFCMDPSPDTTPPAISATSINSTSCVAESQTSSLVEFYVNEPSTCRWSTIDQSYSNMNNEMDCAESPREINALMLYTCRANLTGIKRDGSDYFIRCKDQPGAEENDRNENTESFKFNLRGSTGLKIKRVGPNGTIFGGTSPSPVYLEAETLFGCENGKSICFYSLTDKDPDYLMFSDTNNEDGVHTQRQDLVAGKYRYYIKCVDSGGNLAKTYTDFTLDIDENAPVVARVYKEDEKLKVVTVRPSECSYSFDNCDFSFSEGTQMPFANTTSHIADWKEDRTYYIKCRDEFKNEESDCSVIVKPSKIIY